ncbi:MAG: phosphoribosyltransferase [Microgenomates group bacterium Gr01-1014_7]|nr:MAG: phosphoribosyltransferase [Microgenomates group bacterium Gr01-1014_7]
MNLILDVLFPKKCVGCGKFDSYFCSDCVSNIRQGELICPVCDIPSVFGETHPFCKRVFGLDGLWSLGLYQGSLKKAIQKLKYKPALVRDFVPVLVNIIVEYWTKYQPVIFDEICFDQIKKDKGQGWVVVPVPLFWWRENDRGFNQSKLIGQLLSKKLGLDYCEGLKRIRYTRSQARLKEKDRRKNIRGAFEISSNYTLYPKPYTLLIDDVWTTGSTLKECCYVLKRAGAQKVWALTLAR